MIHFVTANATIMNDSSAFGDLLEEGGYFARDAWKDIVLHR